MSTEQSNIEKVKKEKWNPNTKIDGMTLGKAVETNRLDIVQQFAQKYDVDWDCDEDGVQLFMEINPTTLVWMYSNFY